MAKRVEIKKTVLDRKQYKSTIDSRFKFFKELEPVVDPDTVQELFRLYDKLYALIPIEGEEQSHQYLVERSSELYKIDTQLDSIQPLLDEVASLRGQLLENNRRILELETQLAGGGELDFTSAEQMELLRTQLETANATIATLEQANTLANRATEQASQAAADAAKKAEEAAKQAAENQADAAASAGPDPKFTANVQEIVNMLNKKRSSLRYAKKLLEYPKLKWRHIVGRGTVYSGMHYNKTYATQHWWLFTDDKGDRETVRGRGVWNFRSRRNYTKNYRFLIPRNSNQAGDITVDFVVQELEQGGFTAQEILEAFAKVGNFKNNVKTRIITYKDKDKEDKLGYNFID